MFNLNQAIEGWRREMLAAGIKTPVPLDELESHLREDVEHQTKTRDLGTKSRGFRFRVRSDRSGLER